MNCENKTSTVIPRVYKSVVISPEHIMMQCARHYNVTLDDLLSEKRSRKNGVVPARHMSAYIMRTVLCMSQNKIAKHVNRKDHTTIINAVKRISGYIEKHDDVRKDNEQIMQSLNISL